MIKNKHLNICKAVLKPAYTEVNIPAKTKTRMTIIETFKFIIRMSSVATTLFFPIRIYFIRTSTLKFAKFEE